MLDFKSAIPYNPYPCAGTASAVGLHKDASVRKIQQDYAPKQEVTPSSTCSSSVTYSDIAGQVPSVVRVAVTSYCYLNIVTQS